MTGPIYNANAGFTLIELMVTLTILGIVTALATPSMQTFFDSKRLIGATEEVYQHIQQARLEAIKRSVPVYVNFSANGTTTWSYGISQRSNCNLAETDPTADFTNNGLWDSCALVVDDGDNNVHDDGVTTTDTADLVLNRFASTDHPTVIMNAPAIVGAGTQFFFDPLRGIERNGGGSVTLVSEAGRQLRIAVGALGQLRLCTPNDSVPGYSSC